MSHKKGPTGDTQREVINRCKGFHSRPTKVPTKTPTEMPTKTPTEMPTKTPVNPPPPPPKTPCQTLLEGRLTGGRGKGRLSGRLSGHLSGRLSGHLSGRLGGSAVPTRGYHSSYVGADFWAGDPTKHFSVKKKGFSVKRGEGFNERGVW